MVEEGSVDGDLLEVFDVPHEDHFVTVQSDDSLGSLINNNRHGVGELGILISGNADFLDPSFDVSSAQRGRFGQSHYMFESLRGEYTDDAVRAATEEVLVSHCATEGFLYFDVHPLLKLPLLVEDVKVAVNSKGKHLPLFAADPHKYLHLHLR